MKKSLGRGLSQLMQGKKTDAQSSEPVQTPLPSEGEGNEGISGVSRLMHGHKTGTPSNPGSQAVSSDNPFHKDNTGSQASYGRRVPDWIYYLGDVVLLSAVVWMIILSPTAPTWVEWTTSLMLTIAAALIGIYPWARNILGNDTVRGTEEIPQWSLARKTLEDGSERVFVIHLHEPFTAVEITETSWSGVQPKPIWLSGSPDISPEDMKRLLLGAAEFYKQQTSRNRHDNTSNVSAA